MKKISNGFWNFLKGIARFFDKWLITPITKFFVSIYESFGHKGNGFEKIISNRQALVIISLVCALITFYAIDQRHVTFIDNSAEILYNQKVTANYNEALYVVEGIPEYVDVTLVGRRWDVYLAKQYPMDGVALDLNGLSVGTHSVSFKYERAVSSVEYKVDPSTVNITIYDKISVTKELSTDIIHKDNLDTKLNIESIVLDRDSVIIKGSSHRLASVAIVKAIIDIDKLTNVKVGTTTLTNIPLIAYDANGEKVDVEIVPSTIEATIKISSPSKDVPIKLISSGTLEEGKAIKSLTTDTPSVTIYGAQDAINEIEYLPVTVDVNGVKGDKTYNINLSKPTGIREISVKTITVKLTTDSITSKDIDGISIDTINIGEGLSPQALTEEYIKVTVIVNGSKDVIDGLDTSTIKAYIDLKGLGVGEHEVDVKITGEDTRLTYTPRVKKVKIKIKKA